MSFIKFIVGLLLFVTLFAASALVFGEGLTTNYSDVYVDNLKIGGTYNLTEAVNYPMWIVSKGAGSDIVIETTVPGIDDLKPGYEQIPDKNWVSYSKTSLSLLAGETGKVDVTIKVPDDRKLMGRKFMAHVFITGMPSKKSGGGLAVALGIKGKLLISIAREPLTEKERKELRQKSAAPARGLIVVPEKFNIEGGAPGKAVRVTETEPLKLINPSRETLTVTLESVDPEKTGFPSPEGYEKGAPAEMAFSKKKMTLKPDGVENIEVYVNLPQGTKHVKRNYVIRINVKSQRLDIANYVPVYIE